MKKSDINDRTYISKFLSHIIKISCQSTDIIRKITHFQYFIAVFVVMLLSFSTNDIIDRSK